MITEDVAALLTRELGAFAREIEMFPDDEMPWKTIPGVTNSAANLALHLAGNLQHYIGTVLGGTGYVRNRPVEFSRSSGPRSDILAELQAATRVVQSVIPSLTQAQLDAPYPEAVAGPGKEVRTGLFLLHLCVHASFHLGQAGYLRRVLTGDNRSAGPISLASLVGN